MSRSPKPTPSPSSSPFPLAFATLPELLNEVRRRSTSICISLIPHMRTDKDNAEEYAYTDVEGRPLDLTWMAMLIMTKVQLGLIQYRQSVHPPDDTDPEFPESEEVED